jgi:hypothetical protein
MEPFVVENENQVVSEENVKVVYSEMGILEEGWKNEVRSLGEESKIVL